MPPIQPIKATDTDEAVRSKQNSAITRVNELDNTAADIAAFASSANAAARRAGTSRDEARDYAEQARQNGIGVGEARDEAVAARVGAQEARNEAVTARNTAGGYRTEAHGFRDEAETFRDDSQEARDAAAISRGASHVAAAAALLSATEAETERQEAEAAAARAEGAENSLLEWQGQWVTLKAYKLGDIARQDGTSYVCEEAHTAGVFLTDLAAEKWSIFAQRGAAGPGSGDMLESVYDPQGIGLDTFTRANHTGQQAISTVTGLQAALDGKSAVGHNHSVSQVTGLQAALDSKAASGHSHPLATSAAAGFMSATEKEKLGGINKATALETAAGSDENKFATPAGVEAHMMANAIGWGQTYQSVSRALGHDYWNTTGRPILVSFLVVGNNAFFYPYVDDVNIAWFQLTEQNRFAYSFIVPDGSKYSIQGGNIAEYRWIELR